MKQIKISQKLTDRSNEVFKQYLKEVDSVPIFTPEEEMICAIKAFNGDEDAIEDLITRNLRFVVSVAKQYNTDGIPLQDLIEEGNVGLIEAARRFDPTKGNRFISFAVWWIRKIILDHISKYGKIVRLPANKINALSKLDKQFAELEQKNGRRADIQEVIAEYGLNSDDYNEEQDEFREFMLLDSLSSMNIDSLDRQVGGDDNGNTSSLGEMISDDMFKSTDYIITDKNIVDEINMALDTLKPRDKRVMEALFGLNGHKEMNLKEIGEEEGINVTREMVRQIRNKTLKALKNNPRIRQAYETIS